jgi:hypothetical protein
MSSSHQNVLAANGFRRNKLTVAEAWSLYGARHKVPRPPSSGGWKMAVNGIGILPAPTPGTNRWRDEIRAQRRRLRLDERVNPTWAATDNDTWWVNFFNAR